MLKRRHCFEPYLKDKKKLWKTTGINTDIIVGITALVEVKTYTRWAKSFSATVQVECYTFLEVRGPYTKHYVENVTCVTRNWGSLPHTYCKHKSCTFPPGFQSNLHSASDKCKATFRRTCVWLCQRMFWVPRILASGCIGMRSVRDFMLPPRCKCGLLECYST